MLRGPGIGDNCRGLAVLDGHRRRSIEASIQTPLHDHLRGQRRRRGTRRPAGRARAVRGELKGQIDRFVSIDNAGLMISNVAVGSRRYRVTFKGPGGHSFGAFGTGQSRARARPGDGEDFGDSRCRSEPRTTFNVGRIGGGTSVNSIPFEAWMEVDLRSSDAGALAALDAKFHKAIDDAVVEENARWGGQQTVTAEKSLVGDRPAGLDVAQRHRSCRRRRPWRGRSGSTPRSPKGRPTRTSR